MARFKRSEDYYLNKDLVLKINKDVSIVYGAGTQLNFVTENKDNGNYVFGIYGTDTNMAITPGAIEDYISDFGREIDRRASK